MKPWIGMWLAAVLAVSPVAADTQAIHALLQKHLPLQEDITGRGAKLVRASQEHAQKKPAVWEKDVQQVKGLQGLELLSSVHELVNKRIRYQDDPFNDWLPPYASYSEGGDCEDYAIAKLLLLREAGFAEEALRIITLAPVRLNSPFHVILVAQWQDKVYVLDSPGRAQSGRVVPLDNYQDGDRPVMWGGWSGGFAFSKTTLNRQPAGSSFSGLLLPRRSRLTRMVSGEDRLILVAADLKVITRRERPLNKAEIEKLRLLRAYFHEPTTANARHISAGEAKKLDGFRKLRN